MDFLDFFVFFWIFWIFLYFFWIFLWSDGYYQRPMTAIATYSPFMFFAAQFV